MSILGCSFLRWFGGYKRLFAYFMPNIGILLQAIILFHVANKTWTISMKLMMHCFRFFLPSPQTFSGVSGYFHLLKPCKQNKIKQIIKRLTLIKINDQR